MADQLKKLKTRGYSISKVNFIRQALAGYGGGSAIASEMIQNADDAKASQITFQFTEQALIVRNNSVFTDSDFDNITEIALGEKAQEAGKIGTWGTGFLSVFHITDAPELRSSGEYIVFDPGINDLDVYESEVVDSTEFRLPWRSEPTELSQRLEADIWSAERILELKNNLVYDIYRLVLFLRHVDVIEVYEGDTEPKLAARVERKPPEKQTNGKFIRLQQEIEYKRAGQQPRTDAWLYYWGQIPGGLRPAGITIKDNGLAIAFPLKKSDWLDQYIPAALYNFLPTPISTGLPFQINGAFFPDNNRQSILLDLTTQREKSAWNQQVLHQLGQLFVEAVLDMREQVNDVRRFYELLPVSDPRRRFLEPVQKPFLETTAMLPIVFTSLNDWRKPSEVFIGRRGSRLPELAAEYLPVLPSGVPQEFRDFLEQKQNIPMLEIKHILNHLRHGLIAGQKLNLAHPMINDREKIELLYSELPAIPSLIIPGLDEYALCLAEDETLWPFAEMWRANRTTRQLLMGTDIRFVDIKMQDKFAGRLEKLVDEFRGANLVVWLTNQSWPEPPFTLTDAPDFIKGKEHLAKWLHFIHSDRNQVDQAKLTELPLIRTINNHLVHPAELVFRCDDTDDQVMLQSLELRFVHQEWVADDDIWAVYHLAGVETLHPRHVIATLPATLEQWRKLPVDKMIDQLGRLFSYFSRHLRKLADNDRLTLRNLPLCVTQQGRLVPVENGDVTLHLSADTRRRSNGQTLAHLDQLELDNLIHSKLLEQGQKFLTDILGLKPLSPVRLIETVIIPYYNDPRLSDIARQDLLRFISEEMRGLPEDQQRILFPCLLDQPLIHCTDGQYRVAKEVYFSSPALDTVFVNGYHTLHPDYGVEVAESDDQDQTPYRRSTWYWLFDLLGINETPTPTDLVQAVQTVVFTGPPTAQRLEAVRRIYDLLNREAGKGDFTGGSEVKRLAQLAWLPARNDDVNWYKPAQLYQASHADFVGEQAPLLRFPESTTQLRGLLGMPAFPTVDIIASHLLASAQENKKIDQYRRVYDEIGRHWNELSAQLQQRLRDEAVVWGDGDKYWPTNRVFLSDYHRGLFGQRRCYLKPPGGDAQRFLEYIGVKEKPDDWHDSIELLLEISADYADNQFVSEHDLHLLHRNFDQLGRQLPSSDGKLHNALDLLAKHKLIPDKKGHLHPPNRIVLDARQDILDQFDLDTIPVVSEDGMTENAYRFLRELGVSRLVLLIQRRPVDTSGSREDTGFSLRLQQLIPAFQRIALTYQEQNDITSTTDLPEKRLQGVKLRVCPKLVVGYELNNGDGWRIQGHSRPEDALYFSDAKELNYLYVKQAKPTQFPFVALARELERILFPNSKESPVIEQLLRIKPAEVQGYLDEHGYRRLYQDEISDDFVEGDQPELTEWDEATQNLPDDDTGTEDVTEDDTYTDAMGTPSDLLEVDEDTPIDDKPNSASQHEFDFDLLDGAENQEEPTETDEPIDETDEKTGMPDHATNSDTKTEDETAPPFTGTRRPVVPVLPNDYGELQRKFGLERTTNGVGDSDTVEADHDWKDPTEPEPKDGVRWVRQTRVTVTFTNRYQGFLPLHRGARQMLHDQPAQLSCQTDFEEWAFPLYINYNEGIIYNQEMLPKFFEAYNIPAGGIVYLERVSHDTVRLFWKPMSSQVENIHCLELLEDGTLDEYEVPAAEFPCEIAEYVLRAEKRLEDLEALFKQAMDKRGVFQTICEVFGKLGRELSYNEIYRGVMAQRMVAKASIDYQLNQRPCFVNVGGDHWRFEPERGSEPTQTTRHRKLDGDPGSSEGIQTEITTSTKSEESQPSVPKNKSPYHHLIEDILQELEMLGSLLQLNGKEPLQQLERLDQGLIILGQRLQADLAALAQSHPQLDDLLTMLWQKLLQAPQNQEAQQNLLRYLAEQIQQIDIFLRQIEYQLANTPYEQRSFVFPTLSRLAGQMAEQGHVTLAHQLYKMLKEQGAGDFERELEQLAQFDDVNEYIQWANSAETSEEKWQIWYAAWQEYVGFPTLRQAIQQEVQQRVASTERTINSYFSQERIQLAFETYLKLIEEITPLSDAWQTDQKSAALVRRLARQLFEALRREALQIESRIAFRQALQVAAKMPVGITWELSGNIFLEAAQSVAEDYKSHSDNLAAAVLLDYATYYVEKNHWPVDDYVLSGIFEDTGGLYDNLAVVHRAYDFIHRAQRKASTEKKRRLGQRAYVLHQQCDKIDKSEEMQSWQAQAEALAQNPDFLQLVNEDLFEFFCRG